MKNQKEIYEALLEGKKLDNGDFWCYLNDQGILVDDEDCALSLSFDNCSEWDIKPEPMEFWLNIYSGGALEVCSSKETADRIKTSGRVKMIKVREVIE